MKISLIFVLIAIILLFFADLEITTIDASGELLLMLRGALSPRFDVLWDFRGDFLNTITFAFCGLSLGVLLGTVLALFYHWLPVRLFCSFIRAVHEIFWAFLFLPLLGLNSICGVLAIALPYAGILARVYSEILEEADQQPMLALPPGAGLLVRYFYGLLPLIWADVKHYTAYRFECALRSSAVLGFIGLPTLGYHLETAFNQGLWSEAAAIVYAFFLLIASLRLWLKTPLVPVYLVAAFLLLSKQIHVSWSNILHFLTYEVLPWPMRRAGALDGSGAINWFPDGLGSWFWDLGRNEVLPGVWNTVVLTQIAMVATALVTLTTFPSRCNHLAGAVTRRCAFWGLVLLRTTPEYILGWLFLLLWGPSMLPAIAAIALHNGAILAHLTAFNSNRIELRLDAGKRRLDRYLFEVLPQVYGPFLAFLFYRWEVMMRESAILGILGIYTLGFYIDSAFSEQKMDRALLLILATALLNIAVDAISRRLRRRLGVSTRMIRYEVA